jgi:hypothetical protein
MNLFSFTWNQYGKAKVACISIPMALFAFVQFSPRSGWLKDNWTFLSDNVDKSSGALISYKIPYTYQATVRGFIVKNTERPDVFEPAALLLSGNYQMDSLKEALRKAAVVISGKVLSTNILDTTIHHTISEHDPLIRKAVIEIKQVLKGKKIKGTIAVYYASSDDVHWYKSPKPFVGQVAIFLLHSNNFSKQVTSKVYALLSYLDVQELDKKSRIQKLL